MKLRKSKFILFLAIEFYALPTNGMEELPLHEAASRRDYSRARELLAGNPAEVTKGDAGGCTPLHRACCSGSAPIVQLLLEHGADVRVRDIKGDTPLHKASWFGYKKPMRLLLQHGADVCVENNDGDTPLHRIFPFKYKKFLLDLLCYAVLMEPSEEESLEKIAEDKIIKAEQLLARKNRQGEAPKDFLVLDAFINDPQGDAILQGIITNLGKLPQHKGQRGIVEQFKKELHRTISQRIQEKTLEIFKSELRYAITVRVHVSTEPLPFDD